jgi:hypothetical protein
MRFRTVLVAWLHGAGLLAVAAIAKAADPPAEGVTDPWTAEARRHFKTGVKLYQEANYAGALAEFEAAYQKKPGPGSLQNVALCQKALLRYAEAADTLKLLLERHGSELSEEEKTAAKVAYDDLEAHVGSVILQVRPPHARVTFDGRTIDAASLGAPLRTNFGDHTIVADAPGYGRAMKTVKVASGAPVTVEIALTAVMGFLDVRSNDAAAVIAIDGRPVGLGNWSGPVSPDDEHLVQVYRAGYEPFESRVAVAVGETKPIVGTLGARVGTSARTADSGALHPPPKAQPKLGWYSVFGLNALGTGAAPLDFDISGDDTNRGALSVGLRLGKRVFPTFGIEALLDAGTLNVADACDEASEPPPDDPEAFACGSSGQVDRNYQLGWFRFGPAARLSTPGETWRFGAGFGTGLVWHQLKVARHEGQDADGGKATGWDPFFLLEIGFAYHFGHLSIGLDVMAELDGATSLEANFDGRNRSAFEESGNVIPMLGIGLRAGYSQFPTEKKRR